MSKIGVIKLKTRLKKELQIIDTINVMKQISISEFQYLEQQKLAASNFLGTLDKFFSFYRSRGLETGRYLGNKSAERVVVAVSSDEGFLGTLNNQILERALAAHQENAATKIVVIGRRGARKLAEAGVPVEEFPGIPFPLNYAAIQPLKSLLMDLYLRSEVGEVEVVFARCHSFTRQTLEIVKLLPFNLYSSTDRQEEEDAHYVVVEPNSKSIVDYTIALWFGRRLYEIYWESRLSEAACRAIELSERYETLQKDHVKTRVRYLRASHEVIDAGIREVFASHHFFAKQKHGGAALDPSPLDKLAAQDDGGGQYQDDVGTEVAS